MCWPGADLPSTHGRTMTWLGFLRLTHSAETITPGMMQVSELYPGGLLQALAARGEPLLSGFETAPADFAAYWRPHGWAVTELLDGRYDTEHACM